jgi:two-component system, sensor histidine kinase and response regulator
LSEEQQTQLFQPFQQADTSTTRQFGGTGLGLSICKQLADLMDGEVGVASNIGSGSTFWFKVRLSQCQKPVQTVTTLQTGQTGQTAKINEQELSPEAAKSIRNARILLVEDNEFNQEIAVELLESAGAIVTVANNGAEAVEMALESDTVFDCILMDIQMPMMDGFQATARIRGEPRYARVPILAMTANTRSEDRQRGIEAGMNDFLTKPTPPAVLYATLGKYLNR